MTAMSPLPARPECAEHGVHGRSDRSQASDLRSTSPWALVLTLLGCALATALVEVAFAVHAQREWEALVSEYQGYPSTGWTLGPRDYLPGAATMAAVTVLCTAIGGQLLKRRPWRSIAALTLVTGAFVTVSFLVAHPHAESLGFPSFALIVDLGLPLMTGRVPRLLISVWVGTIVLWLVMACSSHTSQLSAKEDSAHSARAALPPDDAALVLAIRRVVISFVVIALLVIAGLTVFFSKGGLQLFFGRPASWSELVNDTSMVLLPLAIWGGWLAGRERTDRHRRIWMFFLLTGVALSAVNLPGIDLSGSLTIPVLVALGVVLAVHRQSVANRVVARLAR